MKKVLFGILGLGTVISLVIVMSCGGSSGTAPTDAGSVAVASAVSAVIVAGGNPLSIDVDTAITPIVVDCPVSGTATISGDVTTTGDSTSGTVTGTVTEVLADCTVKDAAPPKGCGFGNVVANGTVDATVDASGSSTGAFTLTETMKGSGLTFVYDSKTLTCDIDLTLSLTNATTYTEATVLSAITGTICGVDWAQIVTALSDASTMETLCTALSAKATEEL